MKFVQSYFWWVAKFLAVLVRDCNHRADRIARVCGAYGRSTATLWPRRASGLSPVPVPNHVRVFVHTMGKGLSSELVKIFGVETVNPHGDGLSLVYIYNIMSR